jgi:hypothetical protein
LRRASVISIGLAFLAAAAAAFLSVLAAFTVIVVTSFRGVLWSSGGGREYRDRRGSSFAAI